MLDTSVLIWWLAEPNCLGPSASAAISEPENQIYCSVTRAVDPYLAN